MNFDTDYSNELINEIITESEINKAILSMNTEKYASLYDYIYN
jgi:hypothetical protein